MIPRYLFVSILLKNMNLLLIFLCELDIPSSINCHCISDNQFNFNALPTQFKMASRRKEDRVYQTLWDTVIVDPPSAELKFPETEKPFVCPICSTKFQHRRSLLRHMTFACGGEKQFMCQICHQQFFYSFRLKQHYLNKHNVEK